MPGKRRANGQWGKGLRPWNTGTKGVMRRNSGSFGGPLNPGGRPAPIGTRRWNAKDAEVDVKTDQPHPQTGKVYTGRGRRFTIGGLWWRPLRLVNWERVHGPVPKGCVVRRLLPICDCADNLVLITKSVNARLNHGSWTRPPRPWRSLPLDHDTRLAAVMAAVAQVVSVERRR